MLEQIVRGPMLAPREDGSVAYFTDGALGYDRRGVLEFAGSWDQLQKQLPQSAPPVRKADGVLLPPLLDLHTHIPQHPIRGKFLQGVPDDEPGCRLLNGLKRNVFPAEARCNAKDYARQVIENFAADALAHGIVGGAAYMTVSAPGTEIALEILPRAWSVGLVMMNQNCPENLRSDEKNLEADISRLAGRFGGRLIVTDRFAVAVSSPLRCAGCALAKTFGLRTQTHLNEQTAEKRLVETELYPDAASYTDVYRRDGLLDFRCILAHCIHMRSEEWRMIADTGCAIAHCPTSNLILGSGLMSLEQVRHYKIPFAIATDMGASPTVSMLAEMRRFIEVHSGTTPSEALLRATLAPAQILGLDMGRLEPGRPASFIEARTTNGKLSGQSTDAAILSLLPKNLNDPAPTISRVTLGGKPVFPKDADHA